MDYKEITIDIRDEHELATAQIISGDRSVLVMNIPSRNIFANVAWIKAVANNNVPITLVCRSGNRSDKVKALYFAQDDNIKSLENGITNPKIQLRTGPGGLGIQQVLQLVFSAILATLLILTYYMPIQQVRYVLVGFIGFILYQVYSKSCLIGSKVPLKRLD